MIPPKFDATTPLPSLEDVARLWEEYGMLDNIRQHSRVVRDVAMVLAEWLREAGVALYRPAVEVGALLHDIGKTPCLGSGLRHDREGSKLFVHLGYAELAYLVGAHVRLAPDHPIDETFVVYYADKRVKHDRVVSLHVRFDYIEERYGKDNEERLALIRLGRERAFGAERALFALMHGAHAPSDVSDALSRTP